MEIQEGRTIVEMTVLLNLGTIIMGIVAVALLLGRAENSVNSYTRKAIVSVSTLLAILGLVNLMAHTTENPLIVSVEVYSRVLMTVFWFFSLYQAIYAEIKSKAKRGEKELAALNDIAMAVGQSMDLSQILQNALLSVVKIANFEVGFIYLFNEEKNILELAASHGNIPGDLARKLATLKLGQEV